MRFFGLVPVIVLRTLVRDDGGQLGQGGVVDHGDDGHGHVGPHRVGVGHPEEQHHRYEVPRTIPPFLLGRLLLRPRLVPDEDVLGVPVGRRHDARLMATDRKGSNVPTYATLLSDN